MSVAHLNLKNPSAIADQLRKIADDLEKGVTPARNVVVVIDDRDTGEVWIRPLGPMIRTSDVMGLLHYAAASFYEESRNG